MPLCNIGLPVRLQGALYTKCAAYEIQDSTRLDDVTNQNTAFFGAVLRLRIMLVLVIPSFNVCYKAITNTKKR